MTDPCPQCIRAMARRWHLQRDGYMHCLDHGEYSVPRVANATLNGRGISPSSEELAFISSNLEALSYRGMAEKMAEAGISNRTAKGIEHLVHSRGWDKRYRRARPEQLSPMPHGLALTDRIVAVLLRERAANGWIISANQIAAATGILRPHVHRSIRRLVKRGVVEVTPRCDAWSGHRPNTYRWVVPDSGTRVEG